jgi:glycosyltransferase involved in cell wall biosynthesis
MCLFLTVFIPAYNEEQNLLLSVQTIQAKLEEFTIAYEILIVDDGSQDLTGEIADHLADSIPQVRAIHHAKNAGIGAAFVTAVSHARGDWFILIPSDLALAPDDIKRYIAAVQQADIIVGLRSDRSDYTLTRRIVSWVNIKLIQTLFGMKEKQFQYISMYRTTFLQSITIEYWRSAFFHAETIIKGKALGKRIAEVEVKYLPRLSGKATGMKFKMVILTMRDIFRFWIKWIFLGPVRASVKLNEPKRRLI